MVFWLRRFIIVKKWIEHPFPLSLRPLVSLFWRFWAIFGYFQSIKGVLGPFNLGFEGVTKVTKNGFIIIFRYFHGPKSLILVVFWRFWPIFGDFQSNKGVFRPIYPGFGGVTKVTKNGFIMGFTHFHGPWSLIFGVFWRFWPIFGDFQPKKSFSNLLTLGLGGSLK